eukprot:g2399.t1
MARHHHGKSSLGWMFGGEDEAASNSSSNARVSSNTFATGSNQNSGNFITGRSTTKVHAPPGGRSSFNIFGGSSTYHAEKVKKTVPEAASAPTEAPKRTRTSANAFACGSNQNAGNFITDRPTTRVHAPPGGRSSFNIFGGSVSPPKTAARKTKEVVSALTETSKTNVIAKKTETTAVSAGKGRGTSSNAFACGSNQNAGNFITDRPSTRVHAPPGGRSQITFG